MQPGYRLVSSIALDCASGGPDSIPQSQVTFVVIDHEILSTVIRNVPLLWHVQRWPAVSCKSEAQLVLINCLTACSGTMRWLNCALVNLKWLTSAIRSENYEHHHHYTALSDCMDVQAGLALYLWLKELTLRSNV
jgi:hypothetical protein